MCTSDRVILKRMDGNGKPHNITYGFAQSPFGELIIGFLVEKNNAICHLHFVQKNPHTSVRYLQQRWPRAILSPNHKLAEQKAQQMFDFSLYSQAMEPLLVLVNGTPFQLEVWNALLRIPVGETRTYTEVAEFMGKPKAVRAAANAVANNEVAFLIPCHRVVCKGGNMLKYRWGGQTKQQIMNFEKGLHK